jgi:hypothetical protein
MSRINANDRQSSSNGQRREMSREEFIANLDGAVELLLGTRNDLFRQLERGHKVAEECGWPPIEDLTPDFYRSLFDSDPLAARVVDLMPKETWQGTPTVYEEERGDQATDFEQAWDDLSNDISAASRSWHAEEKGSPIWEHLLRADIISGIGQFGVILLGIDDGRNLQDPVDGVEVIANVNLGGREFREVLPDSPPSPSELTTNEKLEVVFSDWQNGEKREFFREMPEQRADSNYRHDPWGAENEHRLWDREREAMILTNQGRLIVNRQTGGVVVNEQNRKSIEGSRRKNALDGGGIGSRTCQESASGVVENESRPDVDPYLGRSAGYPGDGPFIQGTDRQYSQGFGLGMPAPIGEIAPSLSGTDQQYFGVQFGPSERFQDEPPKKKRRLLFLRCFDESLVQIVRYEWNIRNPRFGLPVMYRITLNDPRQPHSGVGLPLATVYVHWSRVVHIADNLHASEIFGFPRMKQVLPCILDSRKIRGASGEGYWQSSFPILSLETHPTLGGDVIVDEAGTRQMLFDLKTRLQHALILMGMSAKTLPPQVVDPTPHKDAQIEAICIKIGCPIRVFKGSERGELASSQDDEAWNERKRERQSNYVTPKIICPFVDRLIQIGILPAPGSGQKKQVQNLLRQGYRIRRRVKRRDLASGRVTVNVELVKTMLTTNANGEEEEKTSAIEVAEAGYRVEWPDVDALGKKDKAAIALQNTQALTQFVAGPASQHITFQSWLVHFMGWDEEQAQAVSEEAEKEQEKMEQEHADLADEQGYVPQAPPGYKNPGGGGSDGGQDGFGGDQGDGKGGEGDEGQTDDQNQKAINKEQGKEEGEEEGTENALAESVIVNAACGPPLDESEVLSILSEEVDES